MVREKGSTPVQEATLEFKPENTEKRGQTKKRNLEN